MAGLRQYTVGLGFVLLFGICLIIFMFQFIGLNNPTSPVMTDSRANNTLAEFQARGTELQQLGNEISVVLSLDQPNPVYLFLIIPQAFFIPIKFIAIVIKSTATLLATFFAIFFGTGTGAFAVVLGITSGLILISIVLIILKAIRTGDTG